jgi:hypothetical protein
LLSLLDAIDSGGDAWASRSFFSGHTASLALAVGVLKVEAGSHVWADNMAGARRIRHRRAGRALPRASRSAR